MKKQRIAVFGSPLDPQVARVANLIEEKGHVVDMIAPEDWRGDGTEGHSLFIATSEPATSNFGGADPLACDAAWIRHLPSAHAEIDLAESTKPLAREHTAIAEANAQTRATVVLSTIERLLASNRTVINPPAPGLGLRNRLSQLISLAEAGVRVPKSLVTDDADEARSFIKGRRVVYKPVAGGALARILEDGDEQVLELIQGAPVIFQEHVPGEDVRVIIVDQKIISAVAVDSKPGTVDFREDPDYRAGQASYREVKLPEEVEKASYRAAEALGLRLCGLEIRVDFAHPQAHTVLGANPSPTYFDIEKSMGHPISEAIAEALLK